MTSYDLAHHDFSNPDPWVALSLDRSTYFDAAAKAALMRNNRSWSKRFVLPPVRVLGRLAVALSQIIRIMVPNRLTNPVLLHRAIAWGMTHFVAPDANYLILRHFHIGTQTLRFIGDNIGGMTVRTVPLRPRRIADLVDNVFLQHDLNIYNFIIQINAQLIDQGRDIERRDPGAMDFGAIADIDPEIDLDALPRTWHNVLDLQTAIEIYTPVFSLLLAHADFNRSSNSLQLDETIAIYVARLFDRDAPLGLVNNRHPVVPFSTLEAGFRLMLHGIDAEQLYGFVTHIRAQR